MFEQGIQVDRPKTNPSQMLFAVFLGIGVLLKVVADLNRPPHVHHGVWFWLGLCGPVLMVVGVCFQIRAFLAARREASNAV